MKKTPKNENKTNKSTKYILSLIGGADPEEREVILQEIKTFLVDNAENIKNIKLNLIHQHLDAIKNLNDETMQQAKQAYLNDLIVKFREGDKLYEYETELFDNYEQNDVAEFSTKNLLLSVVRSLYSIYYSYHKNDIELNNKNDEFKFVYSETGTGDTNGKTPAPSPVPASPPPAPISKEDNEDQLLEGAIDLDVVGTSLQEGLETTEAKAAPKPQPKAEAKAEAKARARAIAETEAAENRVAAKKAAEEEAILEKRIGTLLQDEKYKEILEKRDEIRGNINDINSLQKNGIIYKKSIEQLKAEIKYIESVNRLENELEENELESLQETIKEYFLELEQILKYDTETLHKKNVSLIVVAKNIKDRKKNNPIIMWRELKEKLEINYGYLIALYKEHSGIPEEDEESLNNWLNQDNKKSTPNILDSTFDLLPELLKVKDEEVKVVDEEEVDDDGEVVDEEEVDDDGEVVDEDEEFEKIKEREREEKIEELENLVNDLYDMINIIETNKKLKSKLKKDVIDNKVHISYKTTDSNPVTEQESENIFNELNTFYHIHSSVKDKYFKYNLTSKGYINEIDIYEIDIQKIEKDIAELNAFLQKKDRFEELLNTLVPGYNDGVIATIKKTARRVLRAFKTDKTVKTDKNVNEGNDGNEDNETLLQKIDLEIAFNFQSFKTKMTNKMLPVESADYNTLKQNKLEATAIIEQLKKEKKNVLEATKIYEDLQKDINQKDINQKKNILIKKTDEAKTVIITEKQLIKKEAEDIKAEKERKKTAEKLKKIALQDGNRALLEKENAVKAAKAAEAIAKAKKNLEDTTKIWEEKKKRMEDVYKIQDSIIQDLTEKITEFEKNKRGHTEKIETATLLIDDLKNNPKNNLQRIYREAKAKLPDARQNLQKAEAALEKINKEKMPRLQELNTYFEKLNNIPTIEPVQDTLHTIPESDSVMPPPAESPPSTSPHPTIQQYGGKLAKYKSTRDEVYILYKKRRYKKTVYVKENTKTKYCKINNKFYMLSKLKVIG